MVRFFFVHLHASRKFVVNVNINSLTRQYFANHRSFTTIAEEEI